MKRTALYFRDSRQVELREEELPSGQPGQVLVQTQVSAINSGTELLIYRGEAPSDLPADLTIKALEGGLGFPLKYGYATVGRVLEVGRSAAVREGDFVFAFHPHESHFWADMDELHALPPGMNPLDAVLLPSMETAVNFLHDGAPLAGEQVVVFGQGMVGLLTTALLARLPLGRLLSFDRLALRREASQGLGVHASLDPGDQASLDQAQGLLQPFGADLVYELSGMPEALDQAIALTGFNGKVVIGSWYGSKRSLVDLGGRFHRSRIQLVSSQVSTVNPVLSGRWSKARRLAFAWRMASEIRPSQFVTHRLPLQQASEAYRLLDQQPEKAIQVVLDYH